MWIRSQDSMSLIEAHGFFSETFEDGKVTIFTNDKPFLKMGEYESKERAIEILDEIHDQLVNIHSTQLTQVSSSSGWLSSEFKEVVYQMPIK